jgi:Rrf2 family protein
VPAGYLSKVLQALGKAGLVEAQRGLRGGYVLARPLDALTVLDVINSVDPLQRITSCPLRLNAHGGTLCALHHKLDEGIALIESLFQETTIGQLVGEPRTGRNPLCEVFSEADGRALDGGARPIVERDRPSRAEPDSPPPRNDDFRR